MSIGTSVGHGATVAPELARLLFVEDDDADVELGLRTLSSEGFAPAVQVVDTEAAFTDALNRFDPELILCDYTLPGWSGETALQLARRLAPETPFIFLSGTLGEEVAVHLLREGAWDYVLKDRPARLGDSVRRALALAAENAALKAAETRSRDATAASQASAQRLRSALDTFIDAVLILEAIRDGAGIVDLVCVDANPQAVALAGNVTVVGQSLRDITASWSDAATCYDKCVSVLDAGTPVTFESTITTPSADHRFLDVHAARLGDGVTLTYRDITLRRQAEQDVKAQSRVFERIARGDSLASIVELVRASVDDRLPGLHCTSHLDTYSARGHPFEPVDEAHPVINVGSTAFVHTDLSTDEIAQVPYDSSGPGAWTIPIVGPGAERLGELTLSSAPPRRLTAREEQVGRTAAHLISMSEDRERTQQHLRFLALHDPLTGLHNRAWTMDMLRTDLAVARRNSSIIAVFFLDLDNFKLVNDSLGHSVGDEVLLAAAGRISAAVRPGDRVGRIGGDEFVVVAPDIRNERQAIGIAERLSARVSEVVRAAGQGITASISIGIVLSDPTSTPESMLRDADTALFRAKAAGRSRWEIFDPAMHAEAMARLVIEAELRTAITEKQFVVHYQPVVSLSDDTVTGYEALVRWNHPERGLLAPGQFLQAAENSGRTVEIGDLVLEQVCDLLRNRPDVLVPISVNISAIQIAKSGWRDRFIARIHACGVDPRRIVIEVTETAFLSVLASTKGDLLELRDHGVGIHLDDFGTGYSSIALLRDLPVSGLKLDLSFTGQLTTDETVRALAAGLAGLANGLNLDCIAEGIETSQQADILRAQGWTHGQGYFYGRPGPFPAAP